MNAIRRLALLAFAAILGLGSAAAAQTPAEPEPEPEHTRRNTTELFLGGIWEEGEDGEDGENAFAVGVAHEYRLFRYVGVGVFAEYAADPLGTWSFGTPLFLHPWLGFRIQLAPGLELDDGDAEFLFRAGLAYEFELSEHWRLLPELNADFVDGTTSVVYGVTLGYAW